MTKMNSFAKHFILNQRHRGGEDQQVQNEHALT